MFQLTWKNKKLFQKFSEVHHKKEDIFRDDIAFAAPLYWEEHCVECAIPSCYESCSLYRERKDKKCARFSYGVMPDNQAGGIFNYGFDVSFERWAKLESYWSNTPNMINIRHLKLEYKMLLAIDKLASYLSETFSFLSPKRRLNRFVSWATEHWIKLRLSKKQLSKTPDGLLIRFFYPDINERSFQLEIFDESLLFRTSIPIRHGWNSMFIEFEKLQQASNGQARIKIWPSDSMPIRVIFQYLDLVIFKKTGSEKIKCLCWDLDNTLWSGVIGDDGIQNVIPNKKAIQLIKDFDKKGILQSIISKNNHDIAWSKIRELELEKYFLHPKINWDPKSSNIFNLSKQLNIGIDTFGLIDDSLWEREEVGSTHSSVRLYHPFQIDYMSVLSEFNQAASQVSANRRELYITGLNRQEDSKSWGSDLNGFLKSCEMEMEIKVPDQNELIRCHELVQRSNQFNLSGKHFNKNDFNKLIEQDLYLSVSLKDKYGDYGIILFTIIKSAESLEVKEFVMSCRVAMKGVEDAFFNWLSNYAYDLKIKNTNIILHESAKNNPLKTYLDSKFTQKNISPNQSCYSLISRENRDFSEFIKVNIDL